MKEILIKELAFFIKEAKEASQPQPIFFLGAGASVTGNIPLAGEIEKRILTDYSSNPRIKKLKENERYYAKLMECLSPHTRNELLKSYIDDAKINVTHIYLAQLLVNGYVDYVLTVNFDNLMLRALALFNEFPSTYDMAILKDLTTTSFKEKSVVYLHGQHHGLWLLNTKDEMDKVKETVKSIFDSIKDKRPWVFIGYSGSDPIFEHIKKLGRFDNELYWVGYNDQLPNKDVQSFLEKPNTNASYVSGYDSDAFMLKLNHELGLPQPEILSKPFSSLEKMLNEINDINDEDHFKGVKERLEIAKKNVKKSIKQFEERITETTSISEEEIKIDNLKEKIIQLLISENYKEKEIDTIESHIIDSSSISAKELLADYYFQWGTSLGMSSDTTSDDKSEELLFQASEKFQKSIELKPDQHDTYYNWGKSLQNLAYIRPRSESDKFFELAGEKYQNALMIDSYSSDALYNWGMILADLAETKSGKEEEQLLNLAQEKFQKVTEIKPEDHEAFYIWGEVLESLAEAKSGAEHERLLQLAVQKYQKATEIKPDDHNAFFSWGEVLLGLVDINSGTEPEKLLWLASQKFQKVTKIKPDEPEAYELWGLALFLLTKLTTKRGQELEKLYDQTEETLKKGIVHGSNVYNLACLYAQRDNKEALVLLNKSLNDQEITIDHVLNDEDWESYLEDEEFKAIIEKIREKQD